MKTKTYSLLEVKQGKTLRGSDFTSFPLKVSSSLDTEPNSESVLVQQLNYNHKMKGGIK
jgi:hypothetical protein